MCNSEDDLCEDGAARGTQISIHVFERILVHDHYGWLCDSTCCKTPALVVVASSILRRGQQVCYLGPTATNQAMASRPEALTSVDTPQASQKNLSTQVQHKNFAGTARPCPKSLQLSSTSKPLAAGGEDITTPTVGSRVQVICYSKAYVLLCAVLPCLAGQSFMIKILLHRSNGTRFGRP